MSTFRRRVDIVTSEEHGEGEVRAALEDDFHHFRVWAKYQAGALIAVGGKAIRYPYTACLQATEPLERLVGMPLSRVAHSVTRQTDATHQCTHLLDLAGLAIAAAARQSRRRRYDIEIPGRVDNRTIARLTRDQDWKLDWSVNGPLIEAPETYAGVNLREGMARWALQTLSEEEAEAALILRRCTLISLGRERDLDRQIHAVPSGLCYSQQPKRAEQAIRMKGSTWDFESSQEQLCASDQDWLNSRGS
ncbi:DUF2889 domain-containing protein [Stutzerimonas xanthomarina]|uniref:DUF2889 domain-containing protein n=1 Tax=Stutzerimonas xanthomarina TaxID=271420 RepID=UPI003AA8F67B